MRNPLLSKTGKKLNGTIAPIKIEVIDQPEALALLTQVRRQAIYRPYIPHVVEALRALGGGASLLNSMSLRLMESLKAIPRSI